MRNIFYALLFGVVTAVPSSSMAASATQQQTQQYRDSTQCFSSFLKSAMAGTPNTSSNCAPSATTPVTSASKTGGKYANGVGNKYYSARQYDLALQWYLKAGGYPNALYNIGTIYENGLSVPTNYGQAFSYYKRASDLHFGLASYSIGAMIEQGEGTEENDEKAYQWYFKAAQENEGWGMIKVARAYDMGIDVPVDDNKAYLWLQKTITRAKQEDDSDLLASAEKMKSALEQNGYPRSYGSSSGDPTAELKRERQQQETQDMIWNNHVIQQQQEGH